ncbi:aryl-alcohol dehydrogenase-like predicted oxidoreductase [Saccharothrix saharensis]|uniref:Aryl-alcohol dehydrogenase-like predicted oxidoreductase n=1 Tax=Saccharothrix saharensis TaxID=571190 RepID=A0A543JHQ5_9PSEU|nr:aldo/keto reductase [Saccharothrix saharensis]TQM82377.1 aryl-alcohol dehydrogenase-like predicted oxidoreductase [Saccharothrix saharensis]
MRRRFLGNTGLAVSEIALGTMTFGDQTDEPTAHRILDEFTAAGGTFVDTADTYRFGGSERIIGRWLRSHDRDDLVIATKAYGEMAAGAPVNGAGRKHLVRAVEASLERLGTDYIDLYQIHVFDDATPIEETLSTLDRLVGSGKVRFVGACNYTGWQLQKSVDLARRHGWEPFVSLQPLYNLLERDVELELLPICRNEGLGLIPWSPLGGGLLTGKYTRDMVEAPAGTRLADRGQPVPDGAAESTWRVVEAVSAVAAEVGRTPSQVALRWLLQQPGVTAPIIGVRTPEQLRDDLGATGWSLDADRLARLTEAGERALPYPYALQRLPRFVRRSS